MARNHEKAQAMLNRWQRMKRDVERTSTVRPYLATECKTLGDAELFRQQVIKETSWKISEIQNASLGEYRIRELNDEINKLIRERGHWERRIIDLGGPDYVAQSRKDAMLQGAEAQGSMGYKYFGAARDLPGVRELFEKSPAGPAKRTRYEMHKGVTPDYYGYRDDDDGVLEKYEKKAEAKVRKKIIADWHKQQAQKAEATSADVAPAAAPADITTEEEQAGFSSLVKVPTQAQMAETLLAVKKERLLQRLGLKPPTATSAPAPAAASTTTTSTTTTSTSAAATTATASAASSSTTPIVFTTDASEPAEAPIEGEAGTATPEEEDAAGEDAAGEGGSE